MKKFLASIPKTIKKKVNEYSYLLIGMDSDKTRGEINKNQVN